MRGNRRFKGHTAQPTSSALSLTAVRDSHTEETIAYALHAQDETMQTTKFFPSLIFCYNKHSRFT